MEWCQLIKYKNLVSLALNVMALLCCIKHIPFEDYVYAKLFVKDNKPNANHEGGNSSPHWDSKARPSSYDKSF